MRLACWRVDQGNWLTSAPGRRLFLQDTHVIAIEPKHQGRKAGALICKWGVEMAEAWQLPLYFEASPSSVGLYEKMGFQKLNETIVHKKEVLGTPEDIQVPLMVIMPRSLGMTFDEWREATKHQA